MIALNHGMPARNAARWLAVVAAALILFSAAPCAYAAAGWREASTDHFIIYADASDKWLRAFAQRLEKFDAGLRYLHAVEWRAAARSNRLRIYVLENQSAVEKLCGEGCNNINGFYVPRIGGSVAFTPQYVVGSMPNGFGPEVVLFHEYTHHFLLANSAGAHPRWLNEGFAEFNATTQEARDGSMCFGRAAQHRAYGLLGDAKMPLDWILEPGARKFSSRQQDLFYGRSWLLLHYLRFEDARSGQLATYVDAFNKGKSSLDAAQIAFGDLTLLDRELDSYLRRQGLSCYRIGAEHLPVGTISIRSLGAGEAASMPLRMQIDRGLNGQRARTLVTEARRMAESWPEDAAAQTALSEIEFQAGNLDEANTAADRALASDANAFRALLNKGRIATQSLQAERSLDADAWDLARSWFVRANLIDSNAAEPLYLFFIGFGQQGKPPTDNAAEGLAWAFKLSPQDHGLRWAYANHLLNGRRIADARTVLMPLAYDPHRSGNNPALEMLRAIDAGATSAQVIEAGSARGRPASD